MHVLKLDLHAVIDNSMCTIKKLNDKNLVKIIKRFRSIIININFLFYHYFIYLLTFITINLNPLITLLIYYNKSSLFNL